MRLPDVLDAFQVASYDSSNSSLLSLAESLRVCTSFSLYRLADRTKQTNPAEFPLDFDANSNDADCVSALHALSFTKPCLIPERRADFSVYFALDTNGAGTLFTDLALFIQALAQRLNKWSALDNTDWLSPRSPAHPTLQDLAYCWDGVTSAYGVLQFSANRVSVLNIRRMFHQTSLICNPHCYFHRYEYFANGVFVDLDPVSVLFVFQQMEVAARYVHSNDIFYFRLLMPLSVLGNYVMVASSLSVPWTHLSASHSETYVRLSLFCICST